MTFYTDLDLLYAEAKKIKDSLTVSLIQYQGCQKELTQLTSGDLELG